MADFAEAFIQTMKSEGGYVNDPQYPGGETYKGITRKMNSKWDGWIIIDTMKKQKNFPENLGSNAELQKRVKDFYEINYWDKVKGDDIVNQDVAESIFDFAVNAGVVTSSKLAQMTVGANPDGVIGQTTLGKINADDPKTFLALFALNKIARYIAICEQRQESKKYFYGWVKRALDGV
jgi:lysozyme family protein